MKFRLLILSILLTGSFVTSLNAQVIFNGSLNGPANVGDLPAGWSQFLIGSADTGDESGPFGTFNLSPDGGSFVRSGGLHPSVDHRQEGLEQAVNDLIIGTQYEISFYQSSVNTVSSVTGQTNAGGIGQWALFLDNPPGQAQAQASEAHDIADLLGPPAELSLDNTWFFQTLTFTAESESHLLQLTAIVPDSAPADASTFLLIDGVSISAVPEPNASVFLIIGMSFLISGRHRKR